MSAFGNIPPRNRDLVFGYCRMEPKKYHILEAIPMMIKLNCLLFANQNKDEFYDKYLYGETDENVKCNGDTFIVTVNGKEEEEEMNELVHYDYEYDAYRGRFYQVVGQNVVDKFKHKWVFECVKIASTWNEIGVKSKSEPELSSDYSYCTSKSLKNHSWLGDKLIPYKMRNGDIIEMNLNCLDWTLLFKLYGRNSKSYVCSAQRQVPRGEYRAHICVTTTTDSCFKMLSYQMTL